MMKKKKMFKNTKIKRRTRRETKRKRTSKITKTTIKAIKQR